MTCLLVGNAGSEPELQFLYGACLHTCTCSCIYVQLTIRHSKDRGRGGWSAAGFNKEANGKPSESPTA